MKIHDFFTRNEDMIQIDENVHVFKFKTGKSIQASLGIEVPGFKHKQKNICFIWSKDASDISTCELSLNVQESGCLLVPEFFTKQLTSLTIVRPIMNHPVELFEPYLIDWFPTSSEHLCTPLLKKVSLSHVRLDAINHKNFRLNLEHLESLHLHECMDIQWATKHSFFMECKNLTELDLREPYTSTFEEYTFTKKMILSLPSLKKLKWYVYKNSPEWHHRPMNEDDWSFWSSLLSKCTHLVISKHHIELPFLRDLCKRKTYTPLLVTRPKDIWIQEDATYCCVQSTNSFSTYDRHNRDHNICHDEDDHENKEHCKHSLEQKTTLLQPITTHTLSKMDHFVRHGNLLSSACEKMCIQQRTKFFKLILKSTTLVHFEIHTNLESDFTKITRIDTPFTKFQWTRIYQHLHANRETCKLRLKQIRIDQTSDTHI